MGGIVTFVRDIIKVICKKRNAPVDCLKNGLFAYESLFSL